MSDDTKKGSVEGVSSVLDSKNYGTVGKPNSMPVPAGQVKKTQNLSDSDLVGKLDSHSLEAIVEIKVSRFLDQLGSFYPDNMYDMIMKKVEKPLIKQILLRTGGNQVHASRILGINRNTLRKKMKVFGF